MHRAACVVLVGDRRTEQRHDAVTEELVHRALVPVHLGQHEVEGPAHEAMSGQPSLFRECHRPATVTLSRH
jgi:hypothetical protein